MSLASRRFSSFYHDFEGPVVLSDLHDACPLNDCFPLAKLPMVQHE